MTTFQDQPPQSRRALREQLLSDRSRSDAIDDAAEADRPAPSGRRAQRPEAPATLVEVPLDRESEGDQPAAEVDAPTAAERPAADEQPVHEPSVATPWAEATAEPVAHDDSVHGESAHDVAAHDDTAHHDHAETALPVVDSAVATPFPFADQVEATSDDAGQPGFVLRDFSPELNAARADVESGDDATPLAAGASGYVSPYSRRAQRAEAPAAADAGERPSFDSLFADLTVDDSDESEQAEPASIESEQVASEPVERAADERVDTESVDTEHADTESVDSERPDTEQSTVEHSETASSPQAAVETGDAATTTGDVIPVGEPIVVAQPADLQAPLQIPAEERTLSRREWRLMRARAEAEAAAAAEQAGPTGARPDAQPADAATTADGATSTDRSTRAGDIPPLVEPAPEVHAPVSDAMAEFEALTRGAQRVDSSAETSFPSFPAALSPAYASRTTGSVPVERAETDATPAETTRDPAPIAPFSFFPTPPAPQEPAAADAEKASPAASATSSEAVAPAEVAPVTGPYTPPVGHWSRQAEMDDENQLENTLSRDVGGGNVATTTNALVLPMIPERDDFSAVLNATGEIMVTGTINLPGSIGATGRDSRHYDDPEVDHLFDAFDKEIANTGSQPVRAITAVSSHTATRGGIETPRKQSNRMLNVLLVTASVLAVGVLGLLVAGFVLRIF
jgi:hypothetical protein